MKYVGLDRSDRAAEHVRDLVMGHVVIHAQNQCGALFPRELRDRGVAADTEYAGRSLKGQLGHAARLAAATTVVVGPERASIRRAGAADEDVALDEVSARLRA